MSLLVPVRHRNAFPWTGFGDLERQLERAFCNSGAPRRNNPTGWVPAVDIHETDDAFVLEADLPGLSREDVTVHVHEDRVTLRGTRKREENDEQKNYRRYERVDGAFERSFRIKNGIDSEKVKAQFENGVLTVKLPKPENSKPRQIEVKVS